MNECTVGSEFTPVPGGGGGTVDGTSRKGGTGCGEVPCGTDGSTTMRTRRIGKASLVAPLKQRRHSDLPRNTRFEHREREHTPR